MSRLTDRDLPLSAEREGRSWEKPAAADDIVDPIDIGPGGSGMEASSDAFDAEQSEEDEKDVPLDVKFTDALSMLADGGHDYRATPLASEPVLDETALRGEPDDFDTVEIDESSKDA